MKSIKLLLAIACFLLINACKPDSSGPLTSESPDGNTSVEITATRPNAIDPWDVTIKAVSGEIKGGITFSEYYAEHVDSTTVHFLWQNNKQCIITFNERDGKNKMVQLFADGYKLKLLPSAGFESGY